MIRVVLDTNIIVSALLQPLGPSAQIFMLALGGWLQFCMTGSVYAEYEEVISRLASASRHALEARPGCSRCFRGRVDHHRCSSEVWEA